MSNQIKNPYELWKESHTFERAGDHQKLSAFLREHYDYCDKLQMSDITKTHFIFVRDLEEELKRECYEAGIYDLWKLRDRKQQFIRKIQDNILNDKVVPLNEIILIDFVDKYDN